MKRRNLPLVMWLKYIRAHVIITGFVQGVNFRSATRQRASNLGLTGWVKNLHSGEVEAVFEGPEDKVKEMIDWCKKGPPLAQVDDVKVAFSEHKGEFSSFERR